MDRETKMKLAVIEVLIAVILCMLLVILKFVLKEEKIIEDIYNYLVTDIVFLNEI